MHYVGEVLLTSEKTILKILKFKKSGYYFQQTQNRDVANFHGAVLATNVWTCLVIKLVIQNFLMVIF